MIRFALVCDSAHAFESWFRDGASFDEQTKRGLVACPVCNSAHVTKAIMAPAVARRDLNSAAPAHDETETSVATHEPQFALADDKMRALHAMMRELHETITATTQDVGAAFPEEARRIHHGKAEERPIRGAASIDEAKALIEEGIAIMPLPMLPNERN